MHKTLRRLIDPQLLVMYDLLCKPAVVFEPCVFVSQALHLICVYKLMPELDSLIDLL